MPETITITRRVVKGREIFNKRFDDYETGYYGRRISKREYQESREKTALYAWDQSQALGIKERITYQN